MRFKPIIFVGIVASVCGDLFSFTTQPSSITVEKDKSFKLHCVASNGVNTQYQWYKQDSVPETYMSTKYTGTGSLTSEIRVEQAATSHNGFYQCKAKSTGGTLYSDVSKVTVVYFNTISKTTTTKTISTSTEAVRTVLACNVPSSSSNPAAMVTWYKDGHKIDDANMFIVRSSGTLKVESIEDLAVEANSLVIFNIKSGFAGRYDCKATVDNDKISTKTQTIITYDVTVTKEFGNNIDYTSTILTTGNSITVGESVTLCCATIGFIGGKIPTYTWYATNGDNVELSDNLSDYNRMVIIHDVTKSHSYTCKACVDTSCKSGVITVSVSAASPEIEFTTAPGSYVLHEEGSSEGALTITCKTSIGEGNWMKDGKSVSFPIDSPKASDSGYYQCYARTSDKWVMRSTQVVVTEQMTISLFVPSELDDQTTGIIRCTTTGYPTPTTTITKTDVNGHKEGVINCYDSDSSVKGCVRKNGNQYMVTVDNKALDSTGVYTCIASQTYRTLSGAQKITSKDEAGDLAIVQDVDVYFFGTESSELVYGHQVTFTCKVRGGRAPFKVEMTYDDVAVFVWNKEGDNTGEGTCVGDFDKTCYGKVPKVVYTMEGDVTCKSYNTAKNSASKTDSATISTTVTRPVTVEVSGDFFPILDDDLTLTCNHYEKPYSFDPNMVSWKFGGEEIVPNGEHVTSNAKNYHGMVVATFNDVELSNEGVYSCKSESKQSHGVDVYVDHVIAPSTPKLIVPDGEVHTLMNLTCEADGYPPPDLTFTIYSNRVVANETYVYKIKSGTTMMFEWIPDRVLHEMMIRCTAVNVNGTTYVQATLTVVAEGTPSGTSNLDDSEIAAIIAASIIGGVILIICVIFLIICCCKYIRTKKHDRSDGVIIEKGPSKMEQGCVNACIAWCPCCFRSYDEKEVQEPQDKWKFPAIPKISFEATDKTTGKPSPERHTTTRSILRKSSVKRISRREQIKDSPEAKKRKSVSIPREKSKTKIKSKKSKDNDSPISVRVSSFFNSPFLRFDEDEQLYGRKTAEHRAS